MLCALIVCPIPFTPIAFIVAAMALVANTIVMRPAQAGVGLGIVLLVLPLMLLAAHGKFAEDRTSPMLEGTASLKGLQFSSSIAADLWASNVRGNLPQQVFEEAKGNYFLEPMKIESLALREYPMKVEVSV